MTTEPLAELRRLSDAATPGQWYRYTVGHRSVRQAAGAVTRALHAVDVDPEVRPLMTDLSWIETDATEAHVALVGNGPKQTDNADFIVAAVNYVRGLLAPDPDMTTEPQTAAGRLRDAISGERADWHRVDVDPRDIAEVIASSGEAAPVAFSGVVTEWPDEGRRITIRVGPDCWEYPAIGETVTVARAALSSGEAAPTTPYGWDEPLSRWVRHDEYCPAVGGVGTCNCGLAEAMAQSGEAAPVDGPCLRPWDKGETGFDWCITHRGRWPMNTSRCGAAAVDGLRAQLYETGLAYHIFNGNCTTDWPSCQQEICVATRRALAREEADDDRS